MASEARRTEAAIGEDCDFVPVGHHVHLVSEHIVPVGHRHLLCTARQGGRRLDNLGLAASKQIEERTEGAHIPGARPCKAGRCVARHGAARPQRESGEHHGVHVVRVSGEIQRSWATVRRNCTRTCSTGTVGVV